MFRLSRAKGAVRLGKENPEQILGTEGTASSDRKEAAPQGAGKERGLRGQTAWIKSLPATYQLCELRHVCYHLHASGSASVKWGGGQQEFVSSGW